MTTTAAEQNGSATKTTTTRRTAASAASTTASADALDIRGIEMKTMVVPIKGTAPLIMHRFSEKAKKQMLDAMQGRKAPKEPKDPEAEYQSAFYRMDDGTPAFPSVGFKSAIVSAGRLFGKSVKMTALRQQIFVDGELSLVESQKMVRIEGTPQMREDVVRVGMSGTDLRYRPEFVEWSAEITIRYVASALTDDSVLSLLQAAGMGVGVGEWRPERSGDFGTFIINPDKEVQVFGAIR